MAKSTFTVTQLQVNKARTVLKTLLGRKNRDSATGYRLVRLASVVEPLVEDFEKATMAMAMANAATDDEGEPIVNSQGGVQVKGRYLLEHQEKVDEMLAEELDIVGLRPINLKKLESGLRHRDEDKDDGLEPVLIAGLIPFLETSGEEVTDLAATKVKVTRRKKEAAEPPQEESNKK